MTNLNRQFSLMTYILIAAALYILYLIIFAKPKPSLPPGALPMEFANGKMPVSNGVVMPGGDLSANVVPAGDEVQRKPVEQPLAKHASLSLEQKSLLLDVLPSMERIVHLDLKGAAPKVSYLQKLFPLMKTLGATGVLIEWEDMFPYYGELETIAAGDCYSKEDVATMMSLAEENGLTVIPLIQTFGHMEFVLKGAKFKHLRENIKKPTVINPHLPGSLELIQKMVDQQMELQPKVEHLHIGADEVWGLGDSPESQKQMESYGWTKDAIFLNHVREVAGYIKNTYQYVEVMMWDDMFRNVGLKDIKRSKVNLLVTPVVWKYIKDVDTFFKPDLWPKYAKLFRSIWLGSAFKGATGSDQYITDISYHYENHIGWLNILSKISGIINVKGTMVTGWQRYDHFGALCELLPVAIPSLAVCLSAMTNAGVSKSQLNKINGVLGCQPQSPIQWSLDTRDNPAPKCSYPGHWFLEGVYELKNAQYYASSFDGKNSLAAWHKDYNLNRNFAQTARIEYLLVKVDKGLKHITNAETIMNQQFPSYFSEETQAEWLETYINPIRDLILAKKNRAEKMLKLDTWPRRPIHKIVN